MTCHWPHLRFHLAHCLLVAPPRVMRTLCLSLVLLLAFQSCASHTASPAPASTSGVNERGASPRILGIDENGKPIPWPEEPSVGKQIFEGGATALLQGAVQYLFWFGASLAVVTAPIWGPVWLIMRDRDKVKEADAKPGQPEPSPQSQPSDKPADPETSAPLGSDKTSE